MSIVWNPWHGCTRYSEGCAHCYVFRIDSNAQRDSEQLRLNSTYTLPLRCGRDGYKIKSGEVVYTCLSSDFFHPGADMWRDEAWSMMHEREDLNFFIITKRILRMADCLPPDWGTGYPNVTVACTCENQRRTDERLPVFLSLPLAHRQIVCEPLLEKIDLGHWLDRRVECVSAGGESGPHARVCDYDWILFLRDSCAQAGVDFHFHQTGANFRRNGRVYAIPRKLQHIQAARAGIDIAERYTML